MASAAGLVAASARWNSCSSKGASGAEVKVVVMDMAWFPVCMGTRIALRV